MGAIKSYSSFLETFLKEFIFYRLMTLWHLTNNKLAHVIDDYTDPTGPLNAGSDGMRKVSCPSKFFDPPLLYGIFSFQVALY